MAREKKTVVTEVTREQMEEAFAEYAKADARAQKIIANMDVQFTRIREKHQDELAALQACKSECFEVMQTFAMENKDELFSRKKSMETTHGVLGFRTGTPKLKTLKGFTWKAVTTLLQEFMPDYVRTVTEPAKDKLLADREAEPARSLFAKVGIQVVQDESFYVEPKKEEDNK